MIEKEFKDNTSTLEKELDIEHETNFEITKNLISEIEKAQVKSGSIKIKYKFSIKS
ncbi:hypothetical protein [Spiroplasma cantharicola]|uniref:Uncharacterized protein n=1 Tax=Spiroplasma cantharicola TaxID=362837 RepID=A0A0M4JWL0_9MOLU|nr:hypothetical protein [Spiroplasma cantharicola]ALD66355.1 hypothetical protein SCANT_v1c04490 [Spiroplasma cantharicola]